MALNYYEHKTVRESLYTLLKGSPLLQSFKIVEETFNNNKPITERISQLVNLLTQILTSNLKNLDIIFGYFHTNLLNIVLHGDWGKDLAIKYHLTATLKRLRISLEKGLPNVSKRVQYLIKLLSDPWGNPILNKIFHRRKLMNGEELDLIKEEIELVMIVRLKILIEAKCEVQALRLIEVCLRCVRDVKNNVHFQSHSNEIIHIQDLHMILLVRTKKVTKTIDEVKRMGLCECLKMVQRCSKENIFPYLHESCKEMLSFVTASMLTTAMIEPISQESLLVEIIQEFFKINTDIQLLSQPLKNLLSVALSSQHMYILGQGFANNFGVAGQHLCIEMFVRALAVNLNELEKHKNKDDFEAQSLSELCLYRGFFLLADCFQNDVFMRRECILTAFSIKPSAGCLAVLQGMAMESNNNEGNIGNRPSTPPQTDSNINNFANKLLASPIYIADADNLGITQQLSDDLATVIGNARFKELNWTLGWDKLREKCKNYMKENWTLFRKSKKDLKFLSIDYSQFK